MAKAIVRHTDPWSAVVIAITLILFLIALFAKGFTHDLLLEAGVFLVSVKLILMGYKISATAEHNDQHLREIENLLRARGEHSASQGQSTSNHAA